jgi:hypothetical protein
VATLVATAPGYRLPPAVATGDEVLVDQLLGLADTIRCRRHNPMPEPHNLLPLVVTRQ